MCHILLFITVNISLLPSQFYLSPNRIWNILIILHWHPLLCSPDFKRRWPPLLNLLSALFSLTFLLIVRQELLSHSCCISNLKLLTAFNLLNHFLTSCEVCKLLFTWTWRWAFQSSSSTVQTHTLEWILYGSNFCCISYPAFLSPSLSFSFCLARKLPAFTLIELIPLSFCFFLQIVFSNNKNNVI